jgi:hypothetical protein
MAASYSSGTAFAAGGDSRASWSTRPKSREIDHEREATMRPLGMSGGGRRRGAAEIGFRSLP